MQSLGVVARLFPLVEAGQKTSTIRWNETRIEPGYMRYVSDLDPAQTCVVWVTRCTDLALSDAPRFLGKEKEWPREIMLSGMREHYPPIGWHDTVQVVEHLTPEQTRLRADFPQAD